MVFEASAKARKREIERWGEVAITAARVAATSIFFIVCNTTNDVEIWKEGRSCETGVQWYFVRNLIHCSPTTHYQG